jgi:proline iminopeptidase
VVELETTWRWAVLGHSFGGQVALEYALRYPASLSHLVLLDTGGDARWAREHVPELLAGRGWSPEKVELVRRWFNGEFEPDQMLRILLRIGGAYYHHPSVWSLARELLAGGWRSRMRPEALIFAGRHLSRGWTVMDRLGQVTTQTLVLAGRDDFVFPRSASGSWPPGSPARACGSSSAPATTPTRSSPTRHCRRSATSSPATWPPPSIVPIPSTTARG